jgi:membrane-associated HD superfamily phosphohydrolase
MTPEIAAGWSALLAAVATVVGAITLVFFFTRGEPWGRLNDASSVVLMLALIPVALLVATLESEIVTTNVLPVAGLGIAAMLFVATLQALLVVGRVTYEQTKRQVLAGGAVVGLWFILTGALAGNTALEGLLAWLAIASGIGFIAIGYGFAVGNERHPLSALGGVLLLGASMSFLVVLGTRLVTGDIVAPAWNA